MEEYKERMVKEYTELRERYTKLHEMLIKHDAGQLEFKLNCPIGLLREQASIMERYLNILEMRAIIEKVEGIV